LVCFSALCSLFLASGGKRGALDRCCRRRNLRHTKITAARPLTLFALIYEAAPAALPNGCRCMT
ncbi:MAG: hypothetical protein IIZ25_00340, partial [Thermoguttaceae bacterium]|nr:hypothetical protein [Thermoguttaceae bacterium]